MKLTSRQANVPSQFPVVVVNFGVVVVLFCLFICVLFVVVVCYCLLLLFVVLLFCCLLSNMCIKLSVT